MGHHLPRPHGRDELVDRIVRHGADARELPRVRLDREAGAELRNLGHGVLTPLQGFMGSEATESVLEKGRLPNGTPWTLPVLLAAPADLDVGAGDVVALGAADGPIVGTLDVEETFRLDLHEAAKRMYGTDDPTHPGVRRFLSRGDRFVAGPVNVFEEAPDGFRDLVKWPAETRRLFAARGWRTVAGYQTRNPPHRGHEYLHKVCMSLTDGVLLHPVVGRKKPGDFRDEVVMDAYRALVTSYYPSDRALLAALPYEMRYAGPKEAIHHAIMRKNFGCTHFVVGRDHAGVPGYYASEAAIEAFDAYPDLGISVIPVRGDHFWCGLCGGVESERTCAHPTAVRKWFSGTIIRDALQKGEAPPPEVMRPEVAQVVAKHGDPFVGEN